jgi:hypothetical protein
MTYILPNIVEINDRTDVARENLRALVEQAAAYAGPPAAALPLGGLASQRGSKKGATRRGWTNR